MRQAPSSTTPHTSTGWARPAVRSGRRSPATPVAAVIAALTIAAVLTACVPGSDRARPQPGDTTDYRAAAAAARALPDIGAAEAPRYRRDEFGDAWADIDGNGCSQRQDVLARDLIEVVRASDRCTVLSGTLDPDPYSGRRIAFRHDRVAPPGDPGSKGVQIDHVVSLSAAHAGGAWRWNASERERFANTLDNLRAVDGPTNGAKSDLGPARWLPSDARFVCAYVAAYTRIVTTWALAVRADDRDRLVEVLDGCGAG